MTEEMTPMRQKDLQRVAQHINYHIEHPQRDPIRGAKLGWAYIRTTRWLIERALEAGILGEPEKEAKHG